MGRGLCKSCYAKKRYHGEGGGPIKARMQAYTAAHPAMRAAIWRKHAYGLTEEQWRALYRKQRGRCAICRKPEPINVLNIDHDHGTGRVRGMLCGHCNKALGLMCDDPQLLINGACYLQEYLMSVKKNPIVGVLDYFETASLEAAQSALAMAREILRKRTPPAEKKGRKSRTVRTQPVNQATPIVPPAQPADPPVVQERRRRRTKAQIAEAALQATAAPGLALPGIGPSTIGD